AVSTSRASVCFAAALCEISGSFLIFILAPCTSGTTLNGLRLALGVVAPTTPMCLGSRQPLNWILAMKTASFVGHDAAREALVLSIAGVTAIMVIESLILLTLY